MKRNSFSIVKLIIFIIFFLVITTFFLTIYVIPKMKEYKTNKIELKRYERLYKKQVNDLIFLEKKRKLLKEKYKKIKVKYERRFDEKDFKIFLLQNFKDVKIKSNYKKNRHIYKISGTINSIEDLIEIINKINSYKSILKINFPIDIKRKDKSYLTYFYISIIN